MKQKTLLFVFALLSAMTASAKTFPTLINGIYYYFNTSMKQARVTSGGNKYTGKVTIPATVTYDGVTYSVTSIEAYAFSGCSGLTSIEIPNSVTAIGSSAFTGCSGLTSVTIPNSVTTIGMEAFYGCSGLTSVTIPNSVTTIEYHAFRDCSSLTSIIIPNSVTSIGVNAFYGCSGLTSVTIPNSVTSIGLHAFSDCSSLTSVTCEAISVPTTGGSAFSDVPLGSATLYVPASALDAYKTAEQWSEFGTIAAIPDGGIRGDVNGDGVVNGTDIQAIINAIVEGEYDEKADVNEDEQVNGTDIQEVINIIVNAD